MIELVMVILLVAILGTITTSRVFPSDTFKMQASRDKLVAAFYFAQQKAMMQTRRVRLITTASSIDVRVDVNSDGIYSEQERASFAGMVFPIELVRGQSLSSHTFDFDRIGRTHAATMVIVQGQKSVSVVVSRNGAVK